AHTSGFVYSVSIKGITGAGLAQDQAIQSQVARVKAKSDLPVVVGFGIKTSQDVARVAKSADGVVVGSALVTALQKSLSPENGATEATVPAVLDYVKDLARGVRG